jgi:large subunit ribosomal protein L6
VGKQPIPIPSGVQVQLQEGGARVKGTKGQLEVPVHPLTKVREEDGSLIVSVDQPDDRNARAMWGLTRALLANAVAGVTAGFEKRLIVVGVGYRADLKGKSLELQVGYSHPVTVAPESGIEFAVEPPAGGIEGAQATLVVRGADKELVGRAAANLRKIRPPEPYKGKGIRYADEYVRRKAGKAAVA